jgi:hypothetical protein
MRAANKLSARRVAELRRPGAKPGLYGDGHGLYIQVSRFWSVEYVDKAAGKSRSKSFDKEKEALALRDHLSGEGMEARIEPYVTTSWLFRFMIDGVERKMGLGATYTVTLAEAREAAKEFRKLTRTGIDPIEVEKAERGRRKAEAAKAVSFKECADRCIEAHRTGWKNAKHAA